MEIHGNLSSPSPVNDIGAGLYIMPSTYTYMIYLLTIVGTKRLEFSLMCDAGAIYESQVLHISSTEIYAFEAWTKRPAFCR